MTESEKEKNKRIAKENLLTLAALLILSLGLSILAIVGFFHMFIPVK